MAAQVRLAKHHRETALANAHIADYETTKATKHSHYCFLQSLLGEAARFHASKGKPVPEQKLRTIHKRMIKMLAEDPEDAYAVTLEWISRKGVFAA